MSRQLNIHDFSLSVSGSALPDPLLRRGVKPRRTIRGCDGDVEIDETSRSVTKTYRHPDPETAVRNAKRETEYASCFSEALAGIKGVACPKIIAWELSAPPRVVMELCPGRGLSNFLLEIDGQDSRIAAISSRIRAGIEIYTRLFGEPYYDFCFNNMLFDEGSGTLTFLDFVVPARPCKDTADTPLEASLGWLVGCACYTLSRPALLRRSGAAHVSLMGALLSGFEGRVSNDRVYACARGAFSQMRDSGGPLRRHYYRTIGTLLAEGCLYRLRRKVLSGRMGVRVKP